MNRALVVSTLTFFVLAALAHADSLPPLAPEAVQSSILIVDHYGNPYASRELTVITGSAQATDGLRLFTNHQGYLSLDLLNQPASIGLESDYPNSPGLDWAAVFQFVPSSPPSSVRLVPVGTLQVEVLDSDNRKVPGATLVFDCLRNGPAIETLNQVNAFTTHPKTGDVLVRRMSVGPCRVHASKNDRTGDVQIDVTQGSFDTVRVRIDRQLETVFPYLPFGLLILVTTTAGIVFYYKRKKPYISMAPKARSKSTPRHGLSHPALLALNERERSVVELLLGSAKPVRQGMLYRKLLIPKTSLARTLDSLQKRGVIQFSERGNHRYIEPSDWVQPLGRRLNK